MLLRYLFWGILFFVTAHAQSLQEQIQSIETRLNHQESRLKLSSHDTVFSLGGRIRMDVVVNNPSVNAASGLHTYDYYLMPKSITSNPKNPKLSMNLKSSRLWFKTQKKTPYGKLRTLLEVDFWGSSGNELVSNSHNMRLRHAYMTLNGWTLGQTFSTFMGNSLADVVLLTSDVAFVRQPMLRYTLNRGFLKWDVALENPESKLLDTDTNTSSIFSDESVPDMVLRVRYEHKNLKASSAVLYRHLAAELSGRIVTQKSWGSHSTLKYKFYGNDFIQASFLYGEGVGRYVSLAYYSDAELQNQTLIPVPIRSWHLSVTHWWWHTLRSSLTYDQVEQLSSNRLSYYESERTEVGHFTVRYTLMPQTLITLEYAKAIRYNPTQTLTLERLTLSFSYIF